MPSSPAERLLLGDGAQKAGSTSLYGTLADAARRAAATGASLLVEPRRKEVNFWDDSAFAARAPSAAELGEYEVSCRAHPRAAACVTAACQPAGGLGRRGLRGAQGTRCVNDK